MRNRLSQKETIFYVLYKKYKDGKNEYLPVFEVMGETYCEELRKWGFVSYECSARLSEMFKENPGLIQRQSIRGKSGATYYGYRITPNSSIPRQTLIKDPALLALHVKISGIRPKDWVTPGELAQANEEADRKFHGII